jgi:hypothetical protein
VDKEGSNNNVLINCKNQDSNLRPWALIPCQASWSQHNEKSEFMERASAVHLYTSQKKPLVKMRRKQLKVFFDVYVECLGVLREK